MKNFINFFFQVQLWTTSNYHWYLKWELASDKNRRPLACTWDPEKFGTLHLIDAKKIYRKFDFIFGIDRSKNFSEKNSAAVAVIDGRNLLFTPFRHVIVPPPMAGATIGAGASIRQIIFPVEEFFDGIAIFLANNCLEIYQAKNLQEQNENNNNNNNNCLYWQKNFHLHSRIFLEQKEESIISHLLWIDEKKFAVASTENLRILESIDESGNFRIL